MRGLIVSEFLTLDGVMQAPGDTDEDRSGGFEHGGWQLSYFDDVFGKTVMQGLTEAGGLLLGRKTYETFAAFWPNQPDDDPVAPTMNRLSKFVVSTTLEEPLAWENSTLISGEVVEEIRELKEADGGDILVIGSGQLVRTLMEHDLVDRYQLMVHPLVLGSGKHLFGEGDPRIELELVDHTVTGTGILILTYDPVPKG